MFLWVATQGERRAETRQRLLDAAAELFAERGVEGSSVDAIAERADRTSGAVYDHFGGKDGLLFALLEGWVDDVAVVIGAELATATTLDERLASIWRNVSDPPSRRRPLDRAGARALDLRRPQRRRPRAPRPAVPRRVGRRRRSRRRVERRRRPRGRGRRDRRAARPPDDAPGRPGGHDR